MALVEELVLRWAPIPDTPQEAFVDDDTPNGKLLFAGGYGSGKSMTGVAKALKLSAMNAPLPGLFTVPDFGHVLDTILPTLEEVDPETGIPWFLSADQFTYHQTHHVLHWIGGGPIHFASGEDPSSIKGPNMAWAGVDEPGIQPYAAWRNTVNRVRHPRAVLRQVFGTGTPEGLGWMMDLFGEERNPLYKVYRMATMQNSELLKHFPEYLEQVRENATDAEIASYLDGKFSNLSGALAYPMFDRSAHWSPAIRQPRPTEPLRVTFDFNVDPMTCVIGQQFAGPSGHEVYVDRCIALYASTVMQVCGEVATHYPSWPSGLIVYGDASGKNRSHQSLRSNYDIIQELLSQIGPVTLKVPSANPPVARRLNSVNRLFHDARGVTRAWLRKTDPVKTCATRDLVRSLEQTVKKPGTDDIWKKPGETITHAGEAFGYWIDREFPAQVPRAIVGSARLEQFL